MCACCLFIPFMFSAEQFYKGLYNRYLIPSHGFYDGYLCDILKLFVAC